MTLNNFMIKFSPRTKLYMLRFCFFNIFEEDMIISPNNSS